MLCVQKAEWGKSLVDEIQADHIRMDADVVIHEGRRVDEMIRSSRREPWARKKICMSMPVRTLSFLLLVTCMVFAPLARGVGASAEETGDPQDSVTAQLNRLVAQQALEFVARS